MNSNQWRERFHRSRAIAMLTVGLMALGLTAIGAPAFADEPPAGSLPSYRVSVIQETGTPTWDADDSPGHDSGAGNNIIRTNDTITYKVEVAYENADGTTPSRDTTITLALPKGVASNQLPPFCLPGGSSLTPATLPDPVVPLTGTSWQSLPEQTLVCNVGDRAPASTFAYPFVVKVRGEVPHGTVLADVEPQVTSDLTDTAVVSSNKVSSVVSAAANWELAKNGTALNQDTGSYVSLGRDSCAWDASIACYKYVFPITLGSSNFGKGSSPALSPIKFTDDISPRALFGNVLGAQMEGDLAKYAPRLSGCGKDFLGAIPKSKIGGSGTATNSVRDTGAITCTQPDGLGKPVEVTLTNTDTSLLTHPTKTAQDVVLPGDLGYVAAAHITIQVPAAAVVAFGDYFEGEYSLNLRNTYSNLTVRGLDGSLQPDGVDATWNNFRSVVVRHAEGKGYFGKSFGGIPGNPQNTLGEGVPGSNDNERGEGRVLPGQEVLSRVSIMGPGQIGDPAATALACDTWDNSKLELVGGPVPGSTRQNGQRIPSSGDPAWISGAVGLGGMNGPLPDLSGWGIRIQYSNGGGSAATAECTSGNWYDDPADVPGNDLAELDNDVYTGVSRVRAYVELPAYGNSAGIGTMLSIHQRVKETLSDRTIVPNWASAKFVNGQKPGLEALAGDTSIPWPRNTYNPQQNVGQTGSRVIVSSAQSRLQKYLKTPGQDDFALGAAGVQQATGGHVVEYRLNPTLTSNVPESQVAMPVWVEDCLPSGQALVQANPVPSQIETVTPPGAGITCPAGATYLKWDLGDRIVNHAIPPIHYSARMSIVAPPGTYTNKALVTTSSEDNSDAKDVARRTSIAQVQLVQPAGVKVDKRAGVPYVEVNRAGETNPDNVTWDIDLINFNAPQQLFNPDVIDRLPAQGVNGTSFNGALELVSVSATDPRIEIWYTSDADLAEAPNDPRNLKSGATVWCDADSGGDPVFRDSGDPATSADCPAESKDVTGLRMRFKPGADPEADIPFLAGDVLKAKVEMKPTSNRAGDVYTNCVTGRVKGLQYNVGPRCEPITVVASSVGDFVWRDLNNNGIQDAGESGIADFPVQIKGTDSDGNVVEESTTTDATGRYGFDNLAAGSYEVTFAPSSLAPAEHFTAQRAGSDAARDSDVDQVSGKSSVTLGFNQADASVDAGVATMVPSISIMKLINGQDANTSPGVVVEPGSTMAVTMVVKNSGEVRLDPVTITDDTISSADITCPLTALDPGQEMTCTASLSAPEIGKTHRNVATATGVSPANPTSGQKLTVTAQDPAHAIGAIPVEPPEVLPPSVQPPSVGQPIAKALPNTGGFAWGLPVSGLVLMILGGLIMRRSRRA